jgi:hypothetical protein
MTTSMMPYYIGYLTEISKKHDAQMAYAHSPARRP